MDKPTTVDEYIAAFPMAVQEKLREMRKCLSEVAPGATEGLKWWQPAFSYQWILYQYAAFKSHVSFYPTPSVVKAFEKELTDYEHSMMTIKFPLDKPLPIPLIKKIAEYRVKESEEQGVKWM